jgi:uncharacterized protein YjbI with pentapeptide repeats
MPEQLDPFDVAALEKSVNDSAVRVSTIWVSFLIFGLYLAVAAANVSDHQLLVEDPVTLPTVSVRLPLTAFFLLTPLLFVVFHFYVLLQVVLLSRTAGAYKKALDATVKTALDRELIRERLANTLFAQILAGSHPDRDILGILLRIMSWTTLVILPLSVLIVFQLKFLPYHSFLITSAHRMLIVSSLIATVLIWPVVLDGQRRISLTHAAKHPWLLVLAGIFGLVSTTLLRFPGEAPVLEILTARSGDSPNREDYCARNWLMTSVFGENFDRLIVRWESVIDPKKFDAMRARTAACVGEPMKSFRGRDLSCAVLHGADFRFSDFHRVTMIETDLQGARLEGACLEDATLDRAILREAYLQKARLDSARFRKADLTAARLQGAAIDRADFTSVIAKNADFTEASLKEAHLDKAIMTGATFVNASMEGAIFQGVELTDATLRGASLNNSVFKLATLDRANLSNVSLLSADFEGASLKEAILERASLGGTRLRNAVLTKAQLHGANLEQADLQGAIFDEADLTETKIAGAVLHRASFRKAQLPGVTFQTPDFEGGDLTEANLKGASLVEARLSGVSLSRAKLSGANLSRADLSGALLDDSELDEAKFPKANLQAAKFDRAKLRSAVFDEGEAQAATFVRADLHSASFAGAKLEGASFIDVVLENVKFEGSSLTHAVFSGAALRGATGAACADAQVLRPRFPSAPVSQPKAANGSAKRVKRGQARRGREALPSAQLGAEVQVAQEQRHWLTCETNAVAPEKYELMLTEYLVGLACQARSQGYVAKAIFLNLDRDPFRQSPNMRVLARAFLEIDAPNCPGARALPDSTKCRLRESAGPDVGRCQN